MVCRHSFFVLAAAMPVRRGKGRKGSRSRFWARRGRATEDHPRRTGCIGCNPRDSTGFLTSIIPESLQMWNVSDGRAFGNPGQRARPSEAGAGCRNGLPSSPREGERHQNRRFVLDESKPRAGGDQHLGCIVRGDMHGRRNDGPAWSTPREQLSVLEHHCRDTTPFEFFWICELTTSDRRAFPSTKKGGNLGAKAGGERPL